MANFNIDLLKGDDLTALTILIENFKGITSIYIYGNNSEEGFFIRN